MSRLNSVKLILVVALALGTQELWAVTYLVGTCATRLRHAASFPTISAALAATPAPNAVLVCPGTYPEQVVIRQGVTLEGIASGGSDQAIIAVPRGGMIPTVVDDFGDPLAVQLWVDNASGPVMISNITLDAAGNGVPSSSFVVGIFYQNSSGLVDEVTTRNQSGNSFGFGITVEGGASNPSVTVQNSSIHDFDSTGICVEANAATSALTATIRNNQVEGPPTNSSTLFPGAINITGGTTSTVTGNLVSDASPGILTQTMSAAGPLGFISDNTVVNSGVGIGSGEDTGVSVTSNLILGSQVGIAVAQGQFTIRGNTLTNDTVGVEFGNPGCFNPNNTGQNVSENTFSDVETGLSDLPPGVGPRRGRFFNVTTFTTLCQ